jgi:hypothetical protein
MPEDETRQFNIIVRNRVVVENGGGRTSETINSLLAMIEERCLAGCPEESSGAVHRCDIEYAPDGSPISIFIDYEEMVADEEYSLLVSNLEIIECPDEFSHDDPGSCDFSCGGNIFRRIICILYRFFCRTWFALSFLMPRRSFLLKYV